MEAPYGGGNSDSAACTQLVPLARCTMHDALLLGQDVSRCRIIKFGDCPC